MRAAAADLEFEEAARLRDELRRLEQIELGLTDAAEGGPRGRSTMGRAGLSGREGGGGKRPRAGGPRGSVGARGGARQRAGAWKGTPCPPLTASPTKAATPR